MKEERSFGIIPVHGSREPREVLLVQHQAGYWSFPKGHQEPGELPLETAKRELFEETGLVVEHLLIKHPFSEHYCFQKGDTLVSKQVDYFLARVKGDVVLQQAELIACQWVPLDAVESLLTYPQIKQVWQQVCHQLES